MTCSPASKRRQYVGPAEGRDAYRQTSERRGAAHEPCGPGKRWDIFTVSETRARDYSTGVKLLHTAGQARAVPHLFVGESKQDLLAGCLEESSCILPEEVGCAFFEPERHFQGAQRIEPAARRPARIPADPAGSCRACRGRSAGRQEPAQPPCPAEPGSPGRPPASPGVSTLRRRSWRRSRCRRDPGCGRLPPDRARSRASPWRSPAREHHARKPSHYRSSLIARRPGSAGSPRRHHRPGNGGGPARNGTCRRFLPATRSSSGETNSIALWHSVQTM